MLLKSELRKKDIYLTQRSYLIFISSSAAQRFFSTSTLRGSLLKTKPSPFGTSTAQWGVQLSRTGTPALPGDLKLTNGNAQASHLFIQLPERKFLEPCSSEAVRGKSHFHRPARCESWWLQPSGCAACCWRPVWSPCLPNLRQRQGWAEVLGFASEVTWPLSRGTALPPGWGNDLHLSRSWTTRGRKKKKAVQTVWVFGYLMWLAWLCKLLRKEMLPAEVATRHCNHTLVIWVLPIRVWLGLGFMTQLIRSLCWEEVGQAERFGERGCPVRSGSRAVLLHDLKSNPDPWLQGPHLWHSSLPRWPCAHSHFTGAQKGQSHQVQVLVEESARSCTSSTGTPRFWTRTLANSKILGISRHMYCGSTTILLGTWTQCSNHLFGRTEAFPHCDRMDTFFNMQKILKVPNQQSQRHCVNALVGLTGLVLEVLECQTPASTLKAIPFLWSEAAKKIHSRLHNSAWPRRALMFAFLAGCACLDQSYSS